MAIECNNGVDIPTLQQEECDGVYTSDICIIHPQALTYLNLPANSSLNVIISSLILALQYKDEQIDLLQNQINDLTP